MHEDDLISRAAAIEAFDDKRVERNYGDVSPESVIKVIESIPAVDAAPVVHGRWVNKNEEGIYGPTYCSVCDFELRIDDMPYCPMCGAKMDGAQKEATTWSN